MSSWGPLSGVAAGVLQASFGQQGEALRVLDRRRCKPAGVGVEVDAGVG